MLVITGMGRSGTSVLARFCHNMGYLVGGKWSSEVNAGMEEPIVVGINSVIRNGESRDVTPEIRGLSRLVIKDPRFVHRKVLEKWLDSRDDLRFLILLRETCDSIASRQAHPDWFSLKEGDRDENELNQCVVGSLLELGQRGTPFRCLTFPNFLSQYERVHELLTEFGQLRIDREQGRQSWRNLVDLDKVHFGAKNAQS